MPLRSKVSTTDLLEPHFVEWGISPEGDAEDFENRNFANRQEALRFADQKDSESYAVWLGEIGAYETDQGNSIQDWIYYWWNEKSEWPLAERGRGGGYPFYAQSRSVTYTPYDNSDRRGQ